MALQPGSSMKVACAPAHALKSITWSLLFTASPGASAEAWIAVVMSVAKGAKPYVVRPGGGSPQDHDTSPEQSERYGSHAALSVRLHTAGHAGSMVSDAWLGLWQ